MFSNMGPRSLHISLLLRPLGSAFSSKRARRKKVGASTYPWWSSHEDLSHLQRGIALVTGSSQALRSQS